ncbi:hypothetical protein GCM10007425_29630 [Lysinibacillus alkalisoli]|uniref:Uncharacterized protein n=1 Tax=Lysinibacillus alkalisoli TaxID=1911548 RepID=A0A917GAQ4_9BACI|nr:phage tail protein [Lysinibacillus alkalisoli]GGG33012.1 hypothetical protein GCM10007425_29630 [Lysinibacillus alkalisoli]
MIESKDQHLLQVISPNLIQGDDSYRAIKAIGDQEAKLFLKIDSAILDKDLERQSDDVIWHLLWENHLLKHSEGLALAKDKKERIDLILSSVELHRYKGTPYAVERALEVVGLEGKKEEWFEYDGEPYHFWVELKLNQKLNDLDLIYDMIMAYKNVRSWFDGFVILALEQGFWYWDDSYSYPVYYKTCGDFWGHAETINQNLGGTLYQDDSYSYPVYFDDVNPTYVQHMDTGVGFALVSDDYSYPVYYKTCGNFETPYAKSAQFNGATDMLFEAYSYPTHYAVCGEFEAGE